MSRRALSDNRDRVVGDPEESAAAASGGDDVMHMERAIDLARQTQPHPNPRVGAVIVAESGQVIGQAAHRRAGEPHAEVLALQQAGDATGATAYVTLEPCAHDGRTPPCTKALLSAGIDRVVIGAVDPDRRVSGRGIAELESAGVSVVSGVLADQVEAIDPGYFHHRRTGRPLVTLKLATTLDGQIAAADRTSKWITGEAAREDGHRLRSESDVILVGAGTVIDDDPRLDVRLPGYGGRHPRPVIIAGKRSLPATTLLLGRDPILYTPSASGLDVDEVVVGSDGRVDIASVVADLGRRGYVSALVEGGATLATEMVRSGLVDRIVIYLAAKLGLGTGVPAFAGEFDTIGNAVSLTIDSATALGEDLKIEAKVGN